MWLPLTTDCPPQTEIRIYKMLGKKKLTAAIAPKLLCHDCQAGCGRRLPPLHNDAAHRQQSAPAHSQDRPADGRICEGEILSTNASQHCCCGCQN